jgi:hypothetical protein
MEILEDVFEVMEDNVGATGLGIGLGAMIMSPTVFNAVAKVVKPVAKAMIRGGIIFYERGKEVLAEVKEVGEDLVAEAKAEAKESLAKKHEVAVKAAPAAVATEVAVKAAAPTPKGATT